ncbi:polysaccharide pyruvyl transferase family protein [Eisenbergiella massiliensis]|uniref:polysaccharide pyruvyl transferase family protein n=1 Tax=Eisenbergiella massiliensis TaxID=1720294 RepID=UPI00399540EB
MRKIGLCIVYKNWNYGSMLQSFATLLELRKLNEDYEIIRYERKKDLAFYLNSLPRIFLQDMRYSKFRSLRKKFGKKMHKEFARNDEIRTSMFESFRERNFDNFSPVIKTYNELCDYATRFDAVLVGSDQLWLPSGLDTNFFNLMFVPENVNKIAYAASFGISEIPSKQKNRTIEYLNRINYISVREYSGQKLIRELTGRKVPVIVDPTLVISKEVWDANILDERKIEEDYIFCYLLGNNMEHRVEIQKLSQKKKLKIVTLRHMDEYIEADESFGNYAPYDVGPREFINLIRHASYVCTDSFHGSVFSIINHKQFVSFNRYGEKSKNSRNSRLESLFRQLGIDRRFKGNILDDITEEIDYQKVDQKLFELRTFAENYLKNALN